MKTRFKALVIALVVAVASATAACSSSPDVPDQEEPSERVYRSTQDEEDSAEPQEGQPADPADLQQGQQQAQVPKADGPIAHIDGEPVDADRFNVEVERIVESGQLPVELLSQFKGQLIQKIVDRVLIDRAISEADIDVTEAQLDERIDEIKQELVDANEQMDGQVGSLEEMVQRMGITEEEFHDTVRESLAIEKLLVDRGMEYPSDEELREFYDDNRQGFERAAQARARHILITVEPEASDDQWAEAHAEIIDIREQATADDADFEALAREHSQGPSAESGGDLGWFEAGRMVPEFEEAAFALDKGEVSEPVRTQFGWHLIQKVDEREAGLVEFDEVKARIDTQLRNQRVEQAIEGLLEELHASKEIELHPENVK